jgi:ABC-type sugar transport system ATPase subunit
MVMEHLVVRELTKKFAVGPQWETVLHGVSLSVAKGEFVSLLGPSGCGKTTTLRCIAGLERPTSGAIHIAGVDKTDTNPQQRNIGMCFQEATTYPHMRIRENLNYPLKLRGLNKAECRERVETMAAALKITPLLDKYPSQASGGQRQRVALGRALIRQPDVFLLDEPMSSLDAKLKVEMRKELKLLTTELRTTTVFVTHDQEEAMAVSDRICVMNQGRIEQYDTPEAIYSQPTSDFVASFVGVPAMNLIPCVATGGDDPALYAKGRRIAGASLSHTIADGQALTLGVRPEDLLLEPEGTIPVVVTLVERLGERTIIYLSSEHGELRASMRGRFGRRAGDRMGVTIPTSKMHLFDASGLRMTSLH